VGPNGAGKTSTFRVLATLMEPTHGDVFFDGVDIAENPRQARRLMGYMPDLAPVPSDLKVWEFLDFYAAAYGLRDAHERRQRADRCLETVGLSNLRNNGCRELSRGQTQRVVLAKTLLHEPRVLILDEPASGLDPLARRDLRTALQSLAATGATILISSHILSELSEMCTSLCILNRGRLLAHGSVNEVRSQLGNTRRRLTLGLLSSPSEAADWLAQQPTISELRVESARISFEFTGDDEAQAELLETLVRRRVRLRTFEEKRSSLEELLVEIATPPLLP
jgi:ABC-2 type transport system ATP-binding protein